MTELAPIMVRQTDQLAALSEYAAEPTEIIARRDTIKQVMEKVMQADTHYGTIPGTDKPTLFKPGAELLCATFRIAPVYGEEDLSNDDMIRYRVTCRGHHQNTGILLGEGVGECSSSEEKFKWRRPAGPKEFAATAENRKRTKYASKWDNQQRARVEFEMQQVRTEPFDLANTVLKMAAKRAQVAMTLNVLAASDMFAQDLEDGPTFDTAAPEQRPSPQPTNGGNGNASQKQIELIISKLAKSGLQIDALCRDMQVDGVEAIPKARVNDALFWIDNGGEFPE